jgi:hypothetical protein
MGRQISQNTRRELLEVLRNRYRESERMEKRQILNEFVAVSGYHRKHAIRLLTTPESGREQKPNGDYSNLNCGQRIYDEAFKEALIVMWEAADRICGKRLKVIIPDLIEAMERHGHLKLDGEVRKHLLAASAATIDRLLKPIRKQTKAKRRGHRSSRVSKEIPVRTFADWHEPDPGYFEIDFVAHGGGSMADSFIHTLAMTDVCSGWTECIPLLYREQSLVVAGLEALFRQIPFAVKGIDSDNDGAFINETLVAFCKRENLEFTRSRAYRKNDQAWIEQKNGAVVRRIVGHERFSGVLAGQALAHLYQTTHLYVNYFQPSFKLREKIRSGAKVRRIYHPPATPCERLLMHPSVAEEIKERLRAQRQQLDPLELLHHIREGQTALAALVSEESSREGPGRTTLDQFLSQLPRLWRSGEVRPTHHAKNERIRDWRTRKDPFEAVWLDVLHWLQNDPDPTAKALFERLQQEHPGQFIDGQLRTLQRRVQEWRQVMARKLVYVGMGDNSQVVEVKAVGEEMVLRK